MVWICNLYSDISILGCPNSRKEFIGLNPSDISCCYHKWEWFKIRQIPQNDPNMSGIFGTRDVSKFLEQLPVLHETLVPLRLVGPPGTGKTLLAKAVAGEVPTKKRAGTFLVPAGVCWGNFWRGIHKYVHVHMRYLRLKIVATCILLYIGVWIYSICI